MQDIYLPFFQGAQLYVPLSRVLLGGSLAYAAALPVGAAIAGVPGLIGAAFSAEVFRSMWFAWSAQRAGLDVRMSWNLRVWKRLVSYGLPYRLTDYPNVFFMMFDLLWVTKFVGVTGLGLYALARSFYAQASDITVRMGNVLYMRTLVQYGSGVGRDKIAGDMLRFMEFQLLVSVPVVCWVVGSTAPFLVRRVIPLYSDAIPVMLILLLGAFFVSQNNNLFVMWIAERRLVAYGLSNLFGVFTVGACLAVNWFLLGHRSLEGVAVASVLGYAGYFTYMILTAGRQLWGWRISCRVLFEVIGAAGWMAGVFTFLGHDRIQDTGWIADLRHSAVLALRMIVGVLPLVAFGSWTSGGAIYLYGAAARAVRLRQHDG